MSTETARPTIPSPIDWSAEGIETELGWSLQATYTGFSRAASPAVAPVPGGARGYQVLVAITTETPSSQLALGRRLGIDKNAITAVVDALEAHGYVQRRPDPEDRRMRRIIATDDGRTLLSTARRALRAAEEKLLAGLSDADQRQLRHLLARIALDAGNAESCLA